MNLLTPWRSVPAKPLLSGSKVTLRPPKLDDYDDWSALRLVSRKFLEQWEPSWDDQELTRESFRNRIRRYQDLRKDDLAYPFFILAEDRLVGAITLSNLRRGVAQMGTLGYWIGSAHARQGLMTEAIEIIATHGFRDLRLHRLEAACLPRNTASIGLLEKTGFAQEGYAKSYLRIAGRWEDHLLFARTDPKSEI
jgi:[ribosomal protein S5]-alanine N-acetyltransferase